MPCDEAMLETLRRAAREAARHAYCPHSHFPVGAAVLADGQVFSGCNVENASYGLTMCAERVAIFTAVAAGCKRVEALAVSCPAVPGDGSMELVMPCGACRQVFAEFANEEAQVLVDGVGMFTLNEILPHPFRLSGEL